MVSPVQWRSAAVFLCLLLLATTAPPAVAVTSPARPAEEAAATAAAAAREVKDLRTAASRTVANADGTFTTTLHGAPIHFRDADGAWQPIETNLVPTDRGWRNGANRFAIEFSRESGPGLVTLAADGSEIELSLADAERRPGAAAGRKLGYRGVQRATDLEYELTPEGFKESLILHGADAPSSFTFNLSVRDAAGVDARRLEDGGWAFHRPADETPLFVLDAPVAFEAPGAVARRATGSVRGQPASAQPDDPGATMAVERRGSSFRVTLGIDPAWLAAPERRFPVVLDPTVIISPPTSHAIFQANCATCAGTTATRLKIGGDETNRWRSALKFDISDIPTGVSISGASLKILYDKVCLSTTSCVEAQVLSAHRINNTWTAASTTGSITSTFLVDYSLAASNALAWMTFSGTPVADTVRGWYLGTIANNGFLVRQKTEVATTNGPRPPSPTYSDPAVRPALDVTWTSDGVNLAQPVTFRANGAELRWSRYAGAAPFAGYAVHRSRTKEFTPSAATLVATINDIDRTTYRDTTATAATTFYYQVVAGGAASNEWAAALPAAGLARKVIQPDAAAGKSTFILRDSARTACENYGTRTTMSLGNAVSGTAWSRRRSLVAFDLRDIPAGATVSSAVMSLYYDPRAVPSTTVNAHRVTRAWSEGSGNGSCKGDGATWYDTHGTTGWTTDGGDFDATVAASVTKASRTTPGWDNFTVTSLVNGWVNGTYPNLGVLLKTSTETTTTDNDFYYITENYSPTPSLWPKLVVDYSDPSSAVVAPRVAVSTPGPGAAVSGTAVPLGATAADDNRVTKVEFLVDGVLKATDTAEPYSTTWNSTTATPGTHSVTARATDDAGNVTTSAAVSVSVRNSAAPATSITSPTSGTTVSGTRAVSASASDDVGVSKVEFYFDDLLFAEDTTAPYSVSWNTLDAVTTAFDGVHVLTSRAYDADGQVTTSAPVSVTVANRSGPYKASFAYTIVPQAVVEDAEAGPRTSDPTSDGGTGGGGGGRGLNTSPKDNTAGAALAGAALDGDGAAESAALAESVTTTCTSGVTNVTDSQGYRVDLDVTNTSSEAWKGGDLRVWYRWFTPEGGILFEGPASDDFPQTVQPGQTRTIRLTVMPPALCGGTEAALYQLRFDIYDQDPLGLRPPTWFALKGNRPIDHPVAVGKELIVAKRLNNALGLERYYHYVGEGVGAGMNHLANVANGNSLLHWTPWTSPGRGLSTVLDLTYNSLEERSDSPVGHNFSLAISSLSRFGLPLDIHPNKADEIAGNANRWALFTDGDGTTHRFEGRTAADGSVYWEEPPGVHLWLRTFSDTDPTRKWALTRPDRVTFYYDEDGYPTGVEDRNGNEMRFTLQTVPPGEDPGGAKKRIIRVTDPAGVSGFNGSSTPAAGRSFDITYYSKAEAKKAQVRGKIKEITDHTGSALRFAYYQDGNLMRITQVGGTNADGTFLADRSFVFTYTNPSGSAAAITDPALRVNPDPKTPQSTRLFSVRDPLGRETTFTYYGPGTGALRWKLASRTDRSGARTDFSYNLSTRVTTVTAPLSRVSTFTYDTDGKVTLIRNPKNENTSVAWTPDFHVQKVTQPTGRFTEFAYNANGYLTKSWNELRALTELTYQDLQVRAENGLADPRDASGKWKTGRSIPHLSQLISKTDPKGTATASPTTDFQWRFTYDGAGNVDIVTDPVGGRTNHDWNPDGTMSRLTDAVGMATSDPADRITEFLAYDANGMPTLIEDAEDGRTKVEYDGDGLLRSAQDAEHYRTGANTRADSLFFDYDAFHRLGRQSAPKSTATEPGQLIWSAAEFDANDNQIVEIGPHFGSGFTRTGALTTFAWDAMDRQTLLTNADRSADPAGERTAYTYDAAGRLKTLTSPRGSQETRYTTDFVTFMDYDPLDRVIRRTAHDVDLATGATTQTRTMHYCFDLAGDMVSITAPKANVATVDCASPPSPTTRYEYDAAHRLTKVTDPLNHSASTTYDLNGNVETSTDAAGSVTRTFYDARNLVTKVEQPYVSGASPRVLTTRIDYDAVGNRTRLISPRAWDASSDKQTFSQFVTTYNYDEVNRLVRMDLPTSSVDTLPLYVHHSYDKVGRALWSSLPTDVAAPGAVPADRKTTMTYFDPGWIRSSEPPSEDPATQPAIHFDYNAEGLQSRRAPELPGQPGRLDDRQAVRWEYFVDGKLSAIKDRGGQLATFRYDANNNLVAGKDTSGLTAPSQTAFDIDATYNGFDELAKARRKLASGNFRATKFTYDQNGNIDVRHDDGDETPAGAPVSGGQAYRVQDFTYDAADWLTTQLDDFRTAADGSDDQRITNTFWPTGLEKQRLVAKANGTGGWSTKQTTDWTHFANGQLRTLTTTDATGTVKESHDVDYVQGGIYVNGNRTSDTFKVQGPSASARCHSTTCTVTYQYDARDRLREEDTNNGQSRTTYTLDDAGNILREVITGTGAKTTDYTYDGNRLETVSTGGTVQEHWYDSEGNLDCVTLEAGSQANCPLPTGGTTSPLVLADYTYDYLNRLTSYRSFSSNGTTSTKKDSSDYTYDPLDRLVEQVESHGTGTNRTTKFTHLGLSDLVLGEDQTGGTNPVNKTYSYDAYGNRIGMTNKVGTAAPERLTYGYDVHGSVSLLLREAGGAKASYGYTPYGESDREKFGASSLSQGDTNEDDPTNAYRYAARRFDSGSKSIDMGARRFGPDSGRFLQADVFNGALRDLGLTFDPLTQNRYSFAGGNPISFVEWDGHMFIANGGGGGAATPAPPDDEEENGDDDGGFLDGLAKGASDLWEGAKDTASWAWDSVNFTNEDKFQEQWETNWEVGKDLLWDRPADEVISDFINAAVVEPIKESYESGGFDEAAGRAVFLIGEIVIGGKGLTKLTKAGKLRHADDVAGGAATAGRTVSAFQDLQAAVARAASRVGPGRGPVHGTHVHTALRNEIRALNRPDLHAEVSYKGGRVVTGGTPGSVRLDAVIGDQLAPTAIYDLKTGTATLTPARIAQIRSHLPPGYQNIPIQPIYPP